MVKSHERSSTHCPSLAISEEALEEVLFVATTSKHMGASADLRATSSMSTLLARSLLPSESIDCPQPRWNSHTQQSPALPAQSLIPSYVHFFPARLLPFSPPLLIPQIPHLPSPTHEYTFTVSQS